MLEEMRQDYVRTARATGLSESAVILRHALPNSLLSLITLFGLTFPALASGAVIVERIFGLPGMGKLTFEAVLGRPGLIYARLLDREFRPLTEKQVAATLHLLEQTTNETIISETIWWPGSPTVRRLLSGQFQ